MSEAAPNISSIAIETELKQSYLDYAMSVIVGRALPDVRDGLKPVHRRVLYAMYELKNDWNKPYKKSARIVGDVIGKYHPHGDSAVYDAIVRLAQDFSMRYMLVDGQGNFGSVDGDAPAAMRYTEIRMAKLTHSLLSDIDKETVDFVPNYDNTEFCPGVLPTRVPNLLINGSSGIAVGMATNIPPHNLTEILSACQALIDNPDLDIDGLMEYVSGPDFPTAGIINGRAGIVQAYKTGRGKIYVRARAEVETDKKGKESIIITELPYQVNKARLLEKIALLVKDKRVDGITAIRDESDKEGMRAVIEVRRGENAEVLLNQLYALTPMQTVFGINMVALDNNQPRCLNLKQVLDAFIQHRREVVTRRTIFDLAKARQRAHILEGLGLALSNIDEMIELIKSSKTPAEAKEGLLAKPWALGKVADMLIGDSDLCRPHDLDEHYGVRDEQYYLSPTQAQAILDLKLHRLTGLEQDKILSEYASIIDLIRGLIEILENYDRLMEVISDELKEIGEQFGDERRTEIIQRQDLTDEDLIPREQVVVTFSRMGYAKIQAIGTYQMQHRGGKGKSSTNIKEEDIIEHLCIANTHNTLLCFTNLGRVYWLKAYQLPMAGRGARGKPVVNFLPLQKEEVVTAILPVHEFGENRHLFMATVAGTVKKVALDKFSRPRSSGVIAIDLADDDRLIAVDITEGDNEVLLFSDHGKVIRFHETSVRSMGRGARGVRGIRLGDSNKLVSMIVAKTDRPILTATEGGYGKRTKLEEYRVTSRGGQGVISIQVNERNGSVIDAVQIAAEDHTILISDKGTLVRLPTDEISVVGRNTQGVRLIRLMGKEKLIAMQRIAADLFNEADCEEDEVDAAVLKEGAGVEVSQATTESLQDASQEVEEGPITEDE